MVLVIYGAGGFAKEIYDTVNSASSRTWEEIIFLDDFDNDRTLFGCKILSFDSFIQRYDSNNSKAIIGIGEPNLRAVLAEKMHSYSIGLISIIHPSSIISNSAIIGQGVYIGPFSFISSNSSIADNVVIQPHVMIGHDTSVGHSSVISTNAVLAGNCAVGARTFIALNVSVEQKTIIGDDSIIGMASCVNRDIPSNVIAMGYPARVLKKNELKRVF